MSKDAVLEVRDLHVFLDEKEIIKGVSLKVKQGETHVIMGPNGSGKSTLAKSIMGHPKIKVTKGDILLNDKSILGLGPDKRAKLGLFLEFQNPVEIDGVGFINFLHTAKQSLSGGGVSTKELMTEIKENIASLKLSEDFIGRTLNQGFSGGEKKKTEVLQMSVLKPKIAILDEPDSGLDIDAVKVVSACINRIAESEHMGLLLITHYSRILSYMKPDVVHVMVNGRIVDEGGTELIEKLEKSGYDSYLKADGAKK
jgi:Fe-S cluster assembly ATP-binding protein